VHYSFADYVAFERTSNVKHEFLAGQIYAMAGGTPEHAALSAAVSGLLYAQLRDDCRTYSSDLRVRAGDLTTYPDVTVICGPVERDSEDANTARNPSVVFEVTSPSSEEYDRGEKLGWYKSVPSLQAVVIVSHDRRSIDVWSRRGTDWERATTGSGGIVELDAIAYTLAVDDVYRGVA